MNAADADHRRLEVLGRLNEALDGKLTAGAGASAIDVLQRALSVATIPNECSAPAVALVRYRLAMLRFRSARSAEQLAAVEEMLALAMLSPTLAPRAAVYRLAALARLQAVVPADQRTRIDERLTVANREARILASAERPGGPREGPVQTCAFNLLELAVLLLGGDFSALEGLAAAIEPFDRGEHAVLLGPNPLLARRKVTWAFAQEELDALARRDGPAMLLRLPRDTACAETWTKAKGWHHVAESEARLLVAALDGRRLRGADLLRAIGATEKSFRTAHNRVRKVLAECTGRDKDKVLPGSLNAGIELGQEVTLYCAVHERSIRRRHTSVTTGG